MQDKILCICKNDITSMKGCVKRGPKYFCLQCERNVTKKKINQLIKLIKES